MLFRLSIGLLIELLAVSLYAQSEYNESCGECHEETLRGSVHEVIECVDCHISIDEDTSHEEGLDPPDCSACHEDVTNEYYDSIHGRALQGGITEVAACWDCHSTHDILSGSDPESAMHPNHQAEKCGSCHGHPALAEKYGITIKNPYELYERSVHAYQISQENYDAASCTDCHGVHNIETLTDKTALIHRNNVPETCSKCHYREYEEFVNSIHWEVFERGLMDAPVCNDCHLEHAIASPADPASPVSPLKIPATCSRCHASERFINRFDLPAYRLESYLETYHGLALRGGSAEVATCSSCHGVHEIRAQADPLSMIHPANLSLTCGNCHPGISEGVLIGRVHTDDTGGKHFVVEWVRKVYIWLIFLTIGGVIIHNFLDFRKKVKKGKRSHMQDPSIELKKVLRFNGTERTLHWMTMVSFIILAWSGFGLAYPESILSALWNENARKVIHRISGVVLMAAIVIQFILMVVTKRGRGQSSELVPRRRDFADFFRMLKYYFGKSVQKPGFRRFSYIEKFEYWAFIWGSLLMGITGLGLWFESVMLTILPSWWIDLFTVVHFYEAVLASLAIVFWHFYWVIFDPEVYPGSGVFWHGYMPAERYAEEHSEEWKTMLGEDGFIEMDD